MQLDISRALKSPGVSFGFEVSETMEPISAGGENISFTKSVDVSGNYVFTGEIFFLHGDIHAEYSALCCRCLKEVLSSMVIGFSEEFGKEQDESHPDRYLFHGEKIEIGQMCSETCKGLCPVCGADRNFTDCNCKES
jgi:uncharacterized protein